MNIFDYSTQGRRPAAQQIVSDWKKAGRPALFQVEYGETFAEFEQRITTRGYRGGVSHWVATGNGCEGVKRDAVVRLLDRAVQEPHT